MNFYQHISAFWSDYEPIVWMTVITWSGMRLVFWFEDRARARRAQRSRGQGRVAAAGDSVAGWQNFNRGRRLEILYAQRGRVERILARITAEEARLR